MRRLILFAALLAALLAGCSWNRSDFVCGSNGKPKEEVMPDTAKPVGNTIRSGPHYTVHY